MYRRWAALWALPVLSVGERNRDANRALRRLGQDPGKRGFEIDAVARVLSQWGVAPLDVLLALKPEGPLHARGLGAARCGRSGWRCRRGCWTL